MLAQLSGIALICSGSSHFSVLKENLASWRGIVGSFSAALKIRSHVFLALSAGDRSDYAGVDVCDLEFFPYRA